MDYLNGVWSLDDGWHTGDSDEVNSDPKRQNVLMIKILRLFGADPQTNPKLLTEPALRRRRIRMPLPKPPRKRRMPRRPRRQKRMPRRL